MKTVLDQAKAHRNPENRNWLRAGHADSYGGESNRVEFFVLEGSPARGFIIHIPPHIAYRLDPEGKRIRSFIEYGNDIRRGP